MQAAASRGSPVHTSPVKSMMMPSDDEEDENTGELIIINVQRSPEKFSK